MKGNNIFFRLIYRLKPYRIHYIGLLFITLTGLALSLIQPIIWAKLISILFERNIEYLVKILISLGCLFIFMQIINFIQGIMQSYINVKLTCELQQEVFTKIQNSNLKYYEKYSSGEFTERIVRDINECINTLINQIMPLIISIIKVLVLLIIMFNMNIWLTFISIIILPFIYLISKNKSKCIQSEYIDYKKRNDLLMSFIQYSFKEFKNIKLFNMKDRQIERFEISTNEIGSSYYRISRIGLVFQIIISFLSIISEFVIFIVGSILVISMKISIETFIAFTSYSQQLQQSFFSITGLVPQLSKIKVSTKRIFDLIDNLENNLDTFGEKCLSEFKGEISTDNICFRYHKDKKVLEDVTVKFNCNSTNVIMGNNGQGKTTLINLLLKLYQPTKGNIYLDSIDIRELSEKSIRENICVVTQENFLFNTSIREVLTSNDNWVTELELDNVCEKLDILDFIKSLPNKYETIIEQNNGNFSIGQRQKILIGRALLSKCKIIILDEPTSALDRSAKIKLKSLLSELKLKHTVIIISHDKDLIDDMDYHFELKDNSIIQIISCVERGC